MSTPLEPVCYGGATFIGSGTLVNVQIDSGQCNVEGTNATTLNVTATGPITAGRSRPTATTVNISPVAPHSEAINRYRIAGSFYQTFKSNFIGSIKSGGALTVGGSTTRVQ